MSHSILAATPSSIAECPSLPKSGVICPSCGLMAAYRFTLPHTFVWKCLAPDCRLEFAHPQLGDDDLARAYTAIYYPSDSEGALPLLENTSEAILIQIFHRLRRRFGSLAGVRLLDYGCGSGSLMSLASIFDIRATGVESDPNARRAAALAARAHVYSDITQLRAHEPRVQFDLITLWTVIEHLRRPWEDLAELKTLLRPGGVLLISTNDVRCLRARVRRERWEQYRNPTHFYYFDRRSLSRVIRKAGFPELSEWRLNLRFRHHRRLRRWLYNVTFLTRLSDGLYFLCSARPLSSALLSPSSRSTEGHGLSQSGNQYPAPRPKEVGNVA